LRFAKKEHLSRCEVEFNNLIARPIKQRETRMCFVYFQADAPRSFAARCSSACSEGRPRMFKTNRPALRIILMWGIPV